VANNAQPLAAADRYGRLRQPAQAAELKRQATSSENALRITFAYPDDEPLSVSSVYPAGIESSSFNGLYGSLICASRTQRPDIPRIGVIRANLEMLVAVKRWIGSWTTS
jgi:hypothetical protein